MSVSPNFSLRCVQAFLVQVEHSVSLVQV